MLNLVTSGAFDGTLTIGGGSFTADQGITGDGSSTVVYTGPTSSTGFIPSAISSQYGGGANSINTGFIGVYVRSCSADGSQDIGASSSTSDSFILPSNGSVIGASLNDGAFSDDFANTTAPGNYIVSRTGASSVLVRKNEASLGTTTTAAIAQPTGAFCVLSVRRGGSD